MVQRLGPELQGNLWFTWVTSTLRFSNSSDSAILPCPSSVSATIRHMTVPSIWLSFSWIILFSPGACLKFDYWKCFSPTEKYATSLFSLSAIPDGFGAWKEGHTLPVTTEWLCSYMPGIQNPEDWKAGLKMNLTGFFFLGGGWVFLCSSHFLGLHRCLQADDFETGSQPRASACFLQSCPWKDRDTEPRGFLHSVMNGTPTREPRLSPQQYKIN